MITRIKSRSTPLSTCHQHCCECKCCNPSLRTSNATLAAVLIPRTGAVGMFLDVHVGHGLCDTGAHSEKIVSLDESIRCFPNCFLTSKFFDFVYQAAPSFSFAFDFTLEPGFLDLNFCTGTDDLCPLIDLKFKNSESACVLAGWSSREWDMGQTTPISSMVLATMMSGGTGQVSQKQI